MDTVKAEKPCSLPRCEAYTPIYWLIYLLKRFTIKQICQTNINLDHLQESTKWEGKKRKKGKQLQDSRVSKVWHYLDWPHQWSLVRFNRILIWVLSPFAGAESGRLHARCQPGGAGSGVSRWGWGNSPVAVRVTGLGHCSVLCGWASLSPQTGGCSHTCSFYNWRILQRPLITLRSHAENLFYCCWWKREKSSSCDAQMNLTLRVWFPSTRSSLLAWFRNEANTESFVQGKNVSWKWAAEMVGLFVRLVLCRVVSGEVQAETEIPGDGARGELYLMPYCHHKNVLHWDGQRCTLF